MITQHYRCCEQDIMTPEEMVEHMESVHGMTWPVDTVRTMVVQTETQVVFEWRLGTLIFYLIYDKTED